MGNTEAQLGGPRRWPWGHGIIGWASLAVEGKWGGISPAGDDATTRAVLESTVSIDTDGEVRGMTWLQGKCQQRRTKRPLIQYIMPAPDATGLMPAEVEGEGNRNNAWESTTNTGAYVFAVAHSDTLDSKFACSRTTLNCKRALWLLERHLRARLVTCLHLAHPLALT